MDVVPSGDRHLPDTDFKTEVYQPLGYVLCRGVYRQVSDHCLDGPFRFRVEGVVGQVIGFEVAFH
jgi:hypothetical protein